MIRSTLRTLLLLGSVAEIALSVLNDRERFNEGCTPNDAPPTARRTAADIRARITDFVGRMTLSEATRFAEVFCPGQLVELSSIYDQLGDFLAQCSGDPSNGEPISERAAATEATAGASVPNDGSHEPRVVTRLANPAVSSIRERERTSTPRTNKPASPEDLS